MTTPTTNSTPPNQPAASTNTPFATASLYVGDLAPEVTEAMLFDHFKQVGAVASIRVCRDAITRRSLSYAYVNFHNPSDAERALDTLNYTKIPPESGQPCRIMWSQRDPAKRKSGLGNIFIKNLDESIDNQNLYDTFSTFGNILSCKVEVDNDGNSKGYGYVHYATRDDAENAIAKVDKMLLAGKQVVVTKFRPKKEREEERAKNFTNVFVKNLPKEVSKDDLTEKFKAFGEIQSAVIMFGPPEEEGGEPVSKGFGFVNFTNPDEAQKAVSEANGNADLFSQPIYVGRAQKKQERESELRKMWEERKLQNMQKYQGVNLYVKNLDDTVDEEILRREFSTYGNITSTKIMRDDKGNSKGFGFVCFSAPDEATKAVAEMNTQMVVGKPIYVALAQRKEIRRAQLEAQHRSMGYRIPTGNNSGFGTPMYGGPGFGFGGRGSMPPPGAYPNMRQPRWNGPPGQGGQPGANGFPPQMNQGFPMQRRGPRPNQGGPRGPRNPNQGPRPPYAAQPNARAQNPIPPNQQAPAAAETAPVEEVADQLFNLIEKTHGEKAGKFTGMLIEALSPEEQQNLIQDEDALKAKLEEAEKTLAQEEAADN